MKVSSVFRLYMKDSSIKKLLFVTIMLKNELFWRKPSHFGRNLHINGVVDGDNRYSV